MCVRLRNQASAAIASGAATIASTSLPWKRTTPMWNEKLNGDGKLCGATLAPKARGSPISPKTSSWAMPIVATVRIRRGARAKRRMITNSMNTPRTTPLARPTSIAGRYGQPDSAISSTASDAGSPPRSPCAKLTIRLAR